MDWKWLDDGKTVEIITDSKEKLSFEAASVKESEWTGFYDKIADEGETYSILKKARQAFLMGLAEYSNARANLKCLIQEINVSASVIHQIAKDVDVFFTKPGLVKSFGENRQGLIDFAMEFVARTYTRGISGR